MLLKQWLEQLALWKPYFAQDRTFDRARALTIGLVCGLGRRTITRALGFLGWQHQEWSANYKVFSRSPWEGADLFVPTLEQALRDWIPAGRLIPLALDDTVTARTGKKITTASWQRDPMSPPFHVNLLWGQRFLQASLLLPLYRVEPGSSPRAVPVRFAECPVLKRPGRKASQEQWKNYRQAKKDYSLSAQFVKLVHEQRARLDDLGYQQRGLLALGDGSYCNRTTFRAHYERTLLLCRARKNLRLCFPHPGKGRYYSAQTFTPEEIYTDKAYPWKEVKIIHGGKKRRVRYKEVGPILWRSGGGKQSLRLFVIAPTAYRKTKKGRAYYRERAYLLSTDSTRSAKELLQNYFDRFEIEYNHRDEKDILGVGQSQVWATKSVPRVPELMVAAYSALLMASLAAYGPKRTPDYIALPKWRRPARRASCQDMVNLLREQINAAAKGKSKAQALSDFASMVLSAAA
jgi:hypothetical protein